MQFFSTLVALVLGALVMVAPALAQQAAADAPTAAAPPPPEAFYRRPDIERALLSPSGRWLALTTGTNLRRVALAVFDLREWKLLAVAARFNDADIERFEWLDDDRLVFDVSDRQRGGGDQRWWPGLWVVGRDGSGLTQLVKLDYEWNTLGNIRREPLDWNHMMLTVPRDGSGEILIGEYVFDGGGEFRQILAKRLNPKTGRARSLAVGAPDNVWQWLFDPKGEARGVVTRAKGQATLHWRTPGTDSWREVASFDPLNAPFSPHSVDGAGTLFVTTNEGPDGVKVLKRFDFATGKPEPRALVSAPGFDFRGYLVEGDPDQRALGVRLTTDAETTAWFHPRMAALQAEAEKRWPDRINRLNCARCGTDEMVTLAYSFSDRDPGQYWVHQQANGQWRKIGDRQEGINPLQMALTSLERVKARDGLEIPVWITRPRGPAAQVPRPAVVLVHGGPWVRGREWDWEADAQFLASRGYVVIEPEFRGSTGYGPRLYRAGWKQWGQAMQDDLVDALDFVIGKGWVDKQRVCIAGASYGGYATLMGLVRHGDRFRCGVAWVGVTDPRLMFRWRYNYDVVAEHREHTYPQLVGDPEADRAMLDANTPVLLADRIKAPVLLAYGSDDRRVPLVHGTRMRDALAAAGRPPEWVVYPGEGHGWFKLETRVDFAQRMERFLAQHLQP